MSGLHKGGRRLSGAVLDWLRTERGLFRHPRGVVSFPKSGRTWLSVMLHELEIPARYRHARAETAAPLVEEIDLREGERFRRTLVLVRDPRDTAISYFHACTKRDGIHAEMRHLYPERLGPFLRDPRFGIEKVCRYNLLWAEKAAGSPSFALLTYERLHAETERSLRDVAEFFGRPVSPEAVAAAVEHCRFDKMRQREASGEYGERYGRKLQPANPADPDSYKVRQGRVGGYRDEMTAPDIEFCEQVLERLRYFDQLAGCLETASVGGGAEGARWLRADGEATPSSRLQA